MDTDSAYMALSGPLEKIVRPDCRRTFYEEYGRWFPRPFCLQHETEFVKTKLAEAEGGPGWTERPCCAATRTYDRRTPGLFKVEFEGDGMIALNSKTYYCWDNASDDRFKYSCKGIIKANNDLRADHYKRVLFDACIESGTNKTFTLKDNCMYTQSTRRSGLSYAYTKRVVADDGVSTSNLRL